MRRSHERTFSEDCISRDSAAALLEPSCEIRSGRHLDEVDHKREPLELELAYGFTRLGGNSSTYFLRERVSHVDDVLSSWGLADEIGDIDRFGGAGLVLQALETLAHFISVDLDLNLTGKGNIDVEGVGA